MKTSRTLNVLALGAFLVCAPAPAQQSAFTVNGAAQIVENNYARAKSEGLTDAYKKAVSQCLTRILGEKSFKEKSRLIEEHFLQDPAAFVDRFRIGSENFAGDLYTVEVAVELSLDKIQIELVQSGLDRSKKESLALAVVEEEGDEFRSSWLAVSPTQSQAEKLLALEIQRWGYRIVKPAAIIDPQKLDKIMDDKSWALQLGDRFNAKLLVLGREKMATEKRELSAEKKLGIQTTEEGGGGIYAATALLEMYVVDLESGDRQKVAMLDQTVLGNELAEAKSRVVEQLVRQALPEISLAIEKLSRRDLSGEKAQKVVVEFGGLESYYQYQELISGLKEIDAFKDVELWGFAPGKVKVLVHYSGDRESVRKQIAARGFAEFKVLPVEGDRIELKFTIETLR